jgi:hypothetical protein
MGKNARGPWATTDQQRAITLGKLQKNAKRRKRREEILVTQVKEVLGKPPRCSMQLDLLEYDLTLQDQQAKPC